MFNSVRELFALLRAPWRWARVRCPLCNRDLFASFPPHTVGSAPCRACRDTTPTDLRMGLWGGLAEFPAEADRLSGPEPAPVEAGR